MTKIPEFHFDFTKVENMEVTAAMETLFMQLQNHYNEHIKPAPILFGGKRVNPPGVYDAFVEPEKTSVPAEPVAPDDRKLIRVKPGWEVKDATTLGLKAGNILTGVNQDDVEIFDYVKNYKPGDAIADGESAKYDLSAK